MSVQHTENIKVMVRIRPLSTKEKNQNVTNIIEHSTTTINIKRKKYIFDRVFGPECTQLDVYTYVVGPMIPDILSGYNCTIFAYGQTGTGKTHTICGGNFHSDLDWSSDLTLGFIPRAAINIFDEIRRMPSVDYTVRVSYIELYNEEIHDLLGDHENMPSLSVYNDPNNKGSVWIQGIKEVTVCSHKHIFDLLKKGGNRRKYAPTLMNHQSSRSHTVFTISVHMRQHSGTEEEIIKTGKLNLVDLAGSENIAKSGAKDIRALETANINKSLLTLGRVIQALADKKPQYVPYRNSKLTRILQDSLGGRTKTSMIATLSPAHTCCEETVSTLDYAQRTKDIKNCPEINLQVLKAQLNSDLTSELRSLEKQLEEARALQLETQKTIHLDSVNHSEMLGEIKANQDKVERCKETIRDLERNLKELEQVHMCKLKDVDDLRESFEITKREIDKFNEGIKELTDNIKSEKELSKKLELEQDELCQANKQLLKYTEEESKTMALLYNKVDETFSLTEQGETSATLFVDKVTDLMEKIRERIMNLLETQDLFSKEIQGVSVENMEHLAETGVFCQEIADWVFLEPDKRTSTVHNFIPILDKLGEKTDLFISVFNKNSEVVIVSYDEELKQFLEHLDESFHPLQQQITKRHEELTERLKSIDALKMDKLVRASKGLSQLIREHQTIDLDEEIAELFPEYQRRVQSFNTEFVNDLEDIQSRISNLLKNDKLYGIVFEYFPLMLDTHRSLYEEIKVKVSKLHDEHKTVFQETHLTINNCLVEFQDIIRGFKEKLTFDLESIDESRFYYMEAVAKLLSSNNNLMVSVQTMSDLMSSIDDSLMEEREELQRHSDKTVEFIEQTHLVSKNFYRGLAQVRHGGDTPVPKQVVKPSVPLVKKQREELVNEVD